MVSRLPLAGRGFFTHRPIRMLNSVVTTLSVALVNMPMFGETAAPETVAAIDSGMRSRSGSRGVRSQRVSADPEYAGAITKESAFRSSSFGPVLPGMFSATQMSG